MKVVILAGGLGTRLSEKTTEIPKPMVEIGGRPILWHIMKSYAAYGFNEFIIALGYRGEVIKDYFVNYCNRTNSLSVRLASGEVTRHNGETEDWTVHLLDTGLNTQTGGRVKHAAGFIGKEPFLLTYGDGVANIDIKRLVEFHRRRGKLATVTAVRPPARFGGITLNGDLASHFEEKPQIGEGWINGGFFVLEPGAVDYIEGDATHWEHEPMRQLAAGGELAVYKHEGFWQCMDTLRDVQLLENLWQNGKAPWKIWQE
ncbi:MAG: glucose-1-phosphate cytidylyltransferase [Dehalococcoidia bacterium]|nr:MAG: glucose-1-phosphate cytidylyltransferase [Dehalococcoidia bacterium]